jgi:hypothetical protein
MFIVESLAGGSPSTARYIFADSVAAGETDKHSKERGGHPRLSSLLGRNEL